MSGRHGFGCGYWNSLDEGNAVVVLAGVLAFLSMAAVAAVAMRLVEGASKRWSRHVTSVNGAATGSAGNTGHRVNIKRLGIVRSF